MDSTKQKIRSIYYSNNSAQTNNKFLIKNICSNLVKRFICETEDITTTKKYLQSVFYIP